VPTPEGSEHFESALATFQAELRARRFSDSSKKRASLVLPRFFAWLREQGVHDVVSVTEDHVVAWDKHLGDVKTAKGEPLAAHTRRSYLVCIQRFFRFLERRGVVLQDPTLDLPMPKVQKLPRVVLSRSQTQRLMETPSPYTPVGKRDTAILEVLYGTGIRVSECAALELRDVDLGKGALFIRLGKGKKDRVVPFAGQAAAALDLYLREGRPAFTHGTRQQALFLSSTTGRPLDVGTIETIVHDHARAAGLTVPVTPHTLRHSYATHLIQGGASVRHVQKLLGHSQLSSTAIYTRVFPKDLAKMIEKAHPRERTRSRRGRRKR
jgi:integrase/recombinase XerD